MLARNSEFKGKPLESSTRAAIKSGIQNGSEFVVGDMPNVDSQFIDYLQENGAKFTIYHTGVTPRIKIDDNIIIEELLPGIESLGKTVGDYMKDLTKQERIELRQMIENKEITFKCR